MSTVVPTVGGIGMIAVWLRRLRSINQLSGLMAISAIGVAWSICVSRLNYRSVLTQVD